MLAAGHLCGGAGLQKRFKIAVTIANAGIPGIAVTNTVGIRPASTTSFADTMGLILDTATYSATQGDAEGVVTVSIRPDLIVKALMSGAAAEGTALTLLSNTTASAAGTVITDADVGTADMVSGTVWCITGANVGRNRIITTHSASTSFTVTVPFQQDLAVADEFLFCPWATFGTGAADLDGVGNLQTSTLFTQADATIASGTGAEAVAIDLELNGRSDSAVLFVFRDHQLNVNTN